MPGALITGASRGFGLALAKQLAIRDWDLVIDARTATDLAVAADELRTLGSGTMTALPGDVSDPGHVAALAAAAGELEEFRLLVNNASILGPSPQPDLHTYPVDMMRQVYEVNVLGPLRLIQVCLPTLRARTGAIVNVTSDAAVEAYGGWGGYGSSKAALEQLSNVLSAEEPTIHVYWFDPGDMNTQMHQQAYPGEDISDRPLPETRVLGLMQLLDDMPPSGRYSATQFLEIVA